MTYDHFGLSVYGTTLDNDEESFSNINGDKFKIEECHCERCLLVLLGRFENERINDAIVNNKDGETALIIAIRHGTEETVKFILDRDNKKGWTALMIAINYNQLEMVQAILSHNPNIDIVNNVGQTALDMTKHYCHRSIARYVESYKYK